MSRSRKLRTAFAAALTTGLVVAFAAFGGASIAQSAISAAQYQYQYGKQKVEICHKGKRTIKVAQPAVAAHQRHGDQLGTCASVAAKAKKAKKAKAAKAAKAEARKQSGKGGGKGKG